jgi:archaellum component FlaC
MKRSKRRGEESLSRRRNSSKECKRLSNSKDFTKDISNNFNDFKMNNIKRKKKINRKCLINRWKKRINTTKRKIRINMKNHTDGRD